MSMDARLVVRVHEKAHRVVRTQEFGVRKTEKNGLSRDVHWRAMVGGGNLSDES